MKLDHVKVSQRSNQIKKKNSQYKASCNSTLELCDKRGTQNYQF